jgi:hypothetical protein
MKYGVDFFVLDSITGEKLPLVLSAKGKRPVILQPETHAFAYPDNGSRGFWLKNDFTIVCCFRGKWYKMTVKKGFDFDGASIPQWAWSVVGDPLALTILIAALFHDILFCVNDPEWPLSVTNELFLEIQQAIGACWVKRNTTTKAVQAAGWTTWKKDEAYKAKYRPFLDIVVIDAPVGV